MKGAELMKMKKILAAVLSLLMLLALFPTVALAADGEGSGNAEGIVVSKTAELAYDGTYTINLEAYATGTTTTVTEKSNVPLDVVMIIDQSGSMDGYLTDLKAAVLKFIDNVRTITALRLWASPAMVPLTMMPSMKIQSCSSAAHSITITAAVPARMMLPANTVLRFRTSRRMQDIIIWSLPRMLWRHMAEHILPQAMRWQTEFLRQIPIRTVREMS